MKAIILAAGRGSRMAGLTEENPKCLVELHGAPLLNYQIAALKAGGIHDIAIVTGYREDLLQGWATQMFHNPVWAATNMVTSLSKAEEWLTTDTCVISYSDIFYEPSAIETLTSSPHDIAITYDLNWLSLWQRRFNNPLSDAETFRRAPDNTLIEIGNTPKTIDEIEGQYMGLVLTTPSGWQTCQAVREQLSRHENDKLHMTGLLQHIVNRKLAKIGVCEFNGLWGEIDSASDLRAYCDQKYKNFLAQLLEATQSPNLMVAS